MRAIDLYEGPEGWVASNAESGRCLTFRRESGEAVLGKWHGAEGLRHRRGGLALAGIIRCYSYKAMLLLEPPRPPVPDVYRVEKGILLFQNGAPSYLQKLVLYTVSDALRYAYVDNMARFSPENPFCFNRHLADSVTWPELSDIGAASDLFAYLFSGYYKVISLGANGHLQYRLQRIPDNCGCRYYSRGIDQLGYTANTAVATLSLNGVEFYRVYRGGIPVLFSQYPQARYTPHFRFLVPTTEGTGNGRATWTHGSSDNSTPNYTVVTSAGARGPQEGNTLASRIASLNTPQVLLAHHLYLLLWTDFLPDDEAFLDPEERGAGLRKPDGQFSDEMLPDNCVTFVNLMKATGPEGFLSSVFGGVINRAGRELRTEYDHVLFNSLTRPQLEDEARRLFQHTLRSVDSASSSPSTSREAERGASCGSGDQKSGSPSASTVQARFLKINCLDCVDRTTVMQTLILREAVQSFLDQRLGASWAAPIPSSPSLPALPAQSPVQGPTSNQLASGVVDSTSAGEGTSAASIASITSGVPGRLAGPPGRPIIAGPMRLSPSRPRLPVIARRNKLESLTASRTLKAGSQSPPTGQVATRVVPLAECTPTLQREDIIQLVAQASYTSGRICSLHYMNAPPQRRLQNVLPPTRWVLLLDRYFDALNSTFRYIVNRHAQKANAIYQRIWAGDSQPEYNVSVLSSLNVSLLLSLSLSASIVLLTIASATPKGAGRHMGTAFSGSFDVEESFSTRMLSRFAVFSLSHSISNSASNSASASIRGRISMAFRVLADLLAFPLRLVAGAFNSSAGEGTSSSRMAIPAAICLIVFGILLILVVCTCSDASRDSMWAKATSRLLAEYSDDEENEREEEDEQ